MAGRDLTDAKQCQALVDFAVGTCGKIDVLFNNAAMAYFGYATGADLLVDGGMTAW